MINEHLIPKTCSEIQKYDCTIPMPIEGRVQGIDLCISDLVAALNAANITTVCSCCGHKKDNGMIMLEDGRTLIVLDNSSQKNVDKHLKK